MKEPNLQRMSKEDIDEMKIEAYMKEQTPMEELRANIERSEVMPKKMKEVLLSFDWDTLYRKEEQYAQAKVLEALEREFSKLDGIDFSLIGGTEYYETEVKPNYEQ